MGFNSPIHFKKLCHGVLKGDLGQAWACPKKRFGLFPWGNLRLSQGDTCVSPQNPLEQLCVVHRKTFVVGETARHAGAMDVKALNLGGVQNIISLNLVLKGQDLKPSHVPNSTVHSKLTLCV